uniref:Hexosyltransferase n=1 Tax=Chaetoceros debilis TaxID=122233 RepID=A0A7S3VHJ7_9STRA|mmetsp:Transcript_28024/g.42949  ORF Transcript_28024/g.42949 Transcript_28024/m.42949 type:complete len:382 (+) Transcript_28024:64-1209(+)
MRCYRKRYTDYPFYISPTSIVICGQRVSRKKPTALLVFLVMVTTTMVCWHIGNERILEEIGVSTYTPPPLHTECDFAVAMGSGLESTRGLYASINSIMSNFKNDEKSLCFFVFSTKKDFELRESGLKCAFDSLPKNVRIFNREIRRDEWDEKAIFTPQEASQADVGLTSIASLMEYTFARYYLKPEHVDGMRRVIWIDSDTIIQDDIAKIYDWNLHGKVVGGVNYWQPLKDYLCTNPRLGRISMKTSEGRRNPFQVKKHLNSGLLVMDLYEMQKQHIISDWNKLLQLHLDDCLWKESDKAFNLVIKGKYEELPREWNVGYLGTQEFQRYTSSCEKAKILHWNGVGKPYASEGRGESLCVNQFDAYDIISLEDKAQCLPGNQ